MYTDQSKHAESLAGAFPAQPPSPPAEEKRRRTLREAVETLGVLPVSNDEPLCMLAVANTQANAIRTAQALLEGRLPLADSLGLAIPYEPQHSLPALDWLFESEAMLADYSRPECRYLVAPPGALSEDEEGLVSGRVLDRRRRDLALRTLNDSATAALKTLVELAETGQALAPRLRARLCAAVRQELAAIVAEFSSLERATEVR